MAKKVHAVGVIFEDHEGRILVLRRHAEDPEGGKWGLPGGKIESDETAVSAAVRETEEEIGHQVDSTQLKFLKRYRWDREDLDLVFEVFKLSIEAEEMSIALDSTESTEYVWLPPHELHPRADLMMGLYPILQEQYQSVEGSRRS